MASDQHSQLVERVRDGIQWAQDPQWDGYRDAETALDRLVEQYEDLLRQRIELQNSVGGNIVTIDRLCDERTEAWRKIERLEEQLEAVEHDLGAHRLMLKDERRWRAEAEADLASCKKEREMLLRQVTAFTGNA